MINHPNLVAYYPMENNANDASSQSNNCTVSGATLTDGKIGRCYSFSSSFLSTDDTPGILNEKTVNTPFTIAVWARKTDSNAASIFSSQITNTADGQGIQIGYSGGYMFRISDGSNRRQVNEDGSSTLNNWHHVAITYDGSNTQAGMKIYIDGKEATTNSTDQSVGTISNSGKSYIGMRLGVGIPFNGQIDEAYIFDKVLSVFDIRRIMIGLHPVSI